LKGVFLRQRTLCVKLFETLCGIPFGTSRWYE